MKHPFKHETDLEILKGLHFTSCIDCHRMVIDGEFLERNEINFMGCPVTGKLTVEIKLIKECNDEH